MSVDGRNDAEGEKALDGAITILLRGWGFAASWRSCSNHDELAFA